MFTRCPECRTVFHITAAELRAADGTVVCGACGTTFDALETLSETRPRDVGSPAAPFLAAPEPQPEPEPASESDPEREAAVGPEPEPEPGPEGPEPAPGPVPGPRPELADEGPARDEDEFLKELESLIGGDEAPAEQSGEYMGAWGDARVIEETYSEEGDFPAMAASADALPEEELADEISTGPAADDGLLPDADSVFRLDDDPEEADSGPVEHYLDDDDACESPRIPATPSTAAAADESSESSGIVLEDAAEKARDEPALGDLDDNDAVPEFVHEPRRRGTWIRVLLGLVAILVLAVTWAHTQHGKLLRHPAGAAILGPAYALLGMDVAPDWDPAQFRAIQWEAVATADQPGNLSVAVDFQNAASFDQPYPVIRIVLEDRFGRRVGTHDVSPATYLQDHSPGNRLPAGGRVRTTVVVPDPGARADGFRVDFCIEMPGRGLVCGPEPFR